MQSCPPLSSHWTLTLPGLWAKTLDYEVSGVGERVSPFGDPGGNPTASALPQPSRQ
ncbi:hypothetical protein I79_020841 [Cricetulus griseus]|uniref:Uncharacterized protein n=1 Tax=Cricetulus griseus TaxID=10029 RepID=G3IB52_CRIGR|nr:hypothetical protein I79_020841 [Cricetulus griseus]